MATEKEWQELCQKTLDKLREVTTERDTLATKLSEVSDLLDQSTKSTEALVLFIKSKNLTPPKMYMA
jgi:hypothetical protein